MKPSILIGALVLSGLLVACAPIPKLADPAKPLAAEQVGLHAGTSSEFAADWWTAYHDEQLDALEQRALAQSPSLAAARARIARAAALVENAGAAAKPDVGLETDITRERLTETSIYPPPLGGSVLTMANLQVGVSYDWDFFGRHAAELDSALGQQRAAQADAAAARLMLSSQVAHAYFELARTVEQQHLLEEQTKLRGQAFDLVRQRVDAGLDNQQDRRSAEAPLPELHRQQVQLAAQADQLRHQLAQLTVQAPDSVASLAPRLPDAIALGSQDALTLDLLGRRPDVVAARWRVEASTRDVQVARTQFYPDVSLSAFAGFNSIGLNKLLKSESGQWGVGPSLRLPLFDAGHLSAQLKGTAAAADAAVASYNATVLDAVRDAGDQIVTLQSLDRQQQEVDRLLANAEASQSLAKQRFDAGLGNRLALLAAQGNVVAQQRQALDLRGMKVEAQVNLMRALGGGWSEASAAQSAQSAQQGQ
ncbi:MAG: efflux transporter outer membrane subunit [Pelomonas sp.]|nr:efflux transporter outer membrane subunit [Roseateles sp.]